MRAFLGRFLDCDNDEITASGFRDHVRRCKVTFFPTVRLLGQFSFGVVDVNRNLGAFDFGSSALDRLARFLGQYACEFVFAPGNRREESIQLGVFQRAPWSGRRVCTSSSSIPPIRETPFNNSKRMAPTG